MNFQETVIFVLVALLLVILGRNIFAAYRLEYCGRKSHWPVWGGEIADGRDDDRKSIILDRIKAAGRITNDHVQTLFRVSHTTAWRYLDELEREGRIRQSDDTGRGVFYEIA